jgi:large subunit ribosomal protein L32
MRRAHDFLVAENPGTCTKCGQPSKKHEICGYCGYYRGVEVLKMEPEQEEQAPKK